MYELDATPKRTDEELQPLSGYLNPYAPIRQHRHRLPHWQQGSVYYFVTWRLADSLPREKLARWNEAKKLWLDKNPPPWDSRTQVEYDEKFSQTIDDWLDAGKGSCILADPQLARCVADGLLHYQDKRYVMDSFIVMPNHVHTLFRLIEPHRLETVVKSWKGFTARAINRCLNKHGSLWQEDYWDRMIRDESHFLQCRDYIHANPNKARLNPSQFIFFVRETEGGFFNPPLTADRNVRPPKED